MNSETVRKCYKFGYASPVGKITVCCDEKENIIGLWLAGQKHFGDITGFKFETAENVELETFTLVKKWLDRYFKGEKPKICELPIKPEGSEFRQIVWQILCEIPYGQCITYGVIARETSRRRDVPTISAQAIGGAVAHNPISIVIPCHRVIGSKGNLTGYAAGMDVKIKLLKHEGIDTDLLFIPKKIYR